LLATLHKHNNVLGSSLISLSLSLSLSLSRQQEMAFLTYLWSSSSRIFHQMIHLPSANNPSGKLLLMYERKLRASWEKLIKKIKNCLTRRSPGKAVAFKHF